MRSERYIRAVNYNTRYYLGPGIDLVRFYPDFSLIVPGAATVTPRVEVHFDDHVFHAEMLYTDPIAEVRASKPGCRIDRCWFRIVPANNPAAPPGPMPFPIDVYGFTDTRKEVDYVDFDHIRIFGEQ